MASSQSPSIGTGRVVTATPKLRTRARAAADCSLHHWAVARGAKRRLKRSWVRSRFMKDPCGSSSDPAQQFAQHNPATTAKDDHRPGLPHQSVHELVKLRIGHIHICCEFRATHVRHLLFPWPQIAKSAARQFAQCRPREPLGQRLHDSRSSMSTRHRNANLRLPAFNA